MRIHFIVLSFLIFSKEVSRCCLFIEPSSLKIREKFWFYVKKKKRKYLHRTNLIPAFSKNGWRRLSIDVNWEKIIVFSSPLDFSSISSNSFNVFLIFAESGGNDELEADSYLRFAELAKPTHSLQWVASGLFALLLSKLRIYIKFTTLNDKKLLTVFGIVDISWKRKLPFVQKGRQVHLHQPNHFHS